MNELKRWFGGGGSLVPDISDNKKRIQALENRDNPNLLFNAGFGVNQWFGHNVPNTLAVKAYGRVCDRWLGSGLYGFMTARATPTPQVRSTHYLWFNTKGGSGAHYLQQNIEKVIPKIIGRKVSFSFRWAAQEGTLNGSWAGLVNGQMNAIPIDNIPIEMYLDTAAGAYIATGTFEVPNDYNNNNESMEAGLRFNFPDGFDGWISSVKFEVSDKPTEYVLRDFAEDLAHCHRFYFVDDEINNFQGYVVPHGGLHSDGRLGNPKQRAANYTFPVTMRVPPTVDWQLTEWGKTIGVRATNESASVIYEVVNSGQWGGLRSITADASDNVF